MIVYNVRLGLTFIRIQERAIVLNIAGNGNGTLPYSSE